MKFWMLIFCVLVMSFYDCPAQATQTPPATTPAAPSTPSTPPTSAPATQTAPPSSSQQNRGVFEEQRRQRAQVDNAFEALRMLEVPSVQRQSPSLMMEQLQVLYRKPGKKELKDLLPSQTLLTQYEKFLKQPDTGIFKLSADSSCVTNARVVVATENCLLRDIPGAGTSYSFRVKSHRLTHLSDLILEKDVIKTDGILQQGIMINLGNVELEEVSAQTNGLKFLLDFKPATNIEELKKASSELSEGIKSGEFLYRFAFFADEKTTFAIRSIAYRGKIPRSFNGFNYNEMDYDKRRDILVVFRIIEKEANGNITILWKEISETESPNLKIEQKDKQ